MEERSLEMTEVAECRGKVGEGDGHRNPVCK